MNFVQRTFSSPIGMKAVMAVTGLAMVGFLIAHLAGNLLVFAGPEALSAYARGLRKIEGILWVMRSGLILSVFLHIASGIRLSLLNQRARPQKYAVKKRVKSTFAASYMLLSGLVILSFICFHLAHLTFRLTHPEFAALDPFDIYQMMMISFKSPVLCLFYSVSILLLMLHLNHGIASLFQSLGIWHGNINKFVQVLGAFLSFALGIGFLSIPTAIFFNLVQ